ncbi:hypothetical protein [Streptomyces sp. bgisy154]|uniref:hypothetical protein n=1 Tax=Streptomyces sp. bgisy154 TaxID=3413794 RepID=UPI003D72B2E0
MPDIVCQQQRNNVSESTVRRERVELVALLAAQASRLDRVLKKVAEQGVEVVPRSLLVLTNLEVNRWLTEQADPHALGEFNDSATTVSSRWRCDVSPYSFTCRSAPQQLHTPGPDEPTAEGAR